MKTAELAASDAAFGTDLYKVLAGPGNLVFSPASTAAALRMARLGARGEPAAELARAHRAVPRRHDAPGSHPGLRPRRRLPGGPAALQDRAAGDGHRAA